MRKQLIATTAVIATAGLIAVPALAATKTVKATTSDQWSASRVTVKTGDTVKFIWRNTGAPHNIRKTAGKGRLSGGSKISNSGSATFKVPAKGTYKFLCDVHPETMKFTLRAR